MNTTATTTYRTTTATTVAITTTTVNTVVLPVIAERPARFRPAREVNVCDVVQDRDGNRFLVEWTLYGDTLTLGLVDLDYGTVGRWIGQPDQGIFLEGPYA